MQSTELRDLNMSEELTMEEEYVTQHEPSSPLVLLPVGLRHVSNRTPAEKRGQCVGHHNDTYSAYLGRAPELTFIVLARSLERGIPHDNSGPEIMSDGIKALSAIGDVIFFFKYQRATTILRLNMR